MAVIGLALLNDNNYRHHRKWRLRPALFRKCALKVRRRRRKKELFFLSGIRPLIRFLVEIYFWYIWFVDCSIKEFLKFSAINFIYYFLGKEILFVYIKSFLDAIRNSSNLLYWRLVLDYFKYQLTKLPPDFY